MPSVATATYESDYSSPSVVRVVTDKGAGTKLVGAAVGSVDGIRTFVRGGVGPGDEGDEGEAVDRYAGDVGELVVVVVLVVVGVVGAAVPGSSSVGEAVTGAAGEVGVEVE